MNWVVEILKHQGSRTASTWKKGQETRRRCLGAIECHGRTCGMVLEPSSRGVLRHRQLQSVCIRCEESLEHRTCGVESSVYRFRYGGFFVHRGLHNHPKFTHSTLTRPDGSLTFAEYIPKYDTIKFGGAPEVRTTFFLDILSLNPYPSVPGVDICSQRRRGMVRHRQPPW